LINELDEALRMAERARGLRTTAFPSEPQLPFDKVEDYYRRVDQELATWTAAEAERPAWLGALRGELRDEAALQPRVVARCREAWQDWQSRRAAWTGEPAGLPALEAGAATLRSGLAAARRLFPPAAGELDQLVPPGQLERVDGELRAASARQGWIAATTALRERCRGVQSVLDWRAATGLTEQLATQRAAAAEFAGDVEVARLLRGCEDVVKAWSAADARVGKVAALLAAGDLSAAATEANFGVAGVEGRDELAAFQQAVKAASTAFRELEATLDLRTAIAHLEESLRHVEPHAALAATVGERLAGWRTAMQALQRQAGRMLPIPGGSTRHVPGQVPAFFLSPTEVSRGEYGAFLTDLRALLDGVPAGSRLAKVADRLGGVVANEERLQQLVEREWRRGNDKLPADRLTWTEAAAFAAFRGLSLPTRAEWCIAAFGNDEYPWPWGREFSSDSDARNMNDRELAEVESGGHAWRRVDGRRLHHLAGNVAEWLQAPSAEPTAELAGGRNTDSDAEVREYAGGAPMSADKEDGRAGFGLRTVLRPRSFPGIQWPR
jgi:formylglycine-generating enzyme required for sulfatase activity